MGVVPSGSVGGRRQGHPDGKEKHRLIQDLRKNGVNDVVHISERQVLPRAADHAADLAFATGFAQWGPRMGPDTAAETFTTDFAHAFQTVPSSAEEGRYNCCVVEQPIRRTREGLDAKEPLVGCFILWMVLGFGGRAYPLVYARVA